MNKSVFKFISKPHSTELSPTTSTPTSTFSCRLLILLLGYDCFVVYFNVCIHQQCIQIQRLWQQPGTHSTTTDTQCRIRLWRFPPTAWMLLVGVVCVFQDISPTSCPMLMVIWQPKPHHVVTQDIEKRVLWKSMDESAHHAGQREELQHSLRF